jgi:N-acetyl-beta-hexosaminidase
MAMYKLNKFHIHLADDEGWRIEIKDLPELTEVYDRVFLLVLHTINPPNPFSFFFQEC